MYTVRSIPCPGHEFGLEPCEEYIHQHATVYYGGYFDPPEMDLEEEPDTLCGCETKVPDEQAYWDRVHTLLEAAEWEPDTDDSAYL